MFLKTFLDFDKNPFTELENTTQFENVLNGRIGTVLVDLKNSKEILVPIIRTTTVYDKPAQQFQPIHDQIVAKIKEKTPILYLNNALIEIYDSSYCTMKSHSDQALDLLEDSYICVFSCYSNHCTTDVRKLRVKNKTTSETHEIIMDHCSIVYWHYTTNYKYLHQIVLENPKHDGSKWLGITFRCSKTFIKFIQNEAYFLDNNEKLQLATEKQKNEFYKLRGLENRNIIYEYPKLNYTISPSDLMLPVF
jgi:hypothetical protein